MPRIGTCGSSSRSTPLTAATSAAPASNPLTQRRIGQLTRACAIPRLPRRRLTGAHPGDEVSAERPPPIGVRIPDQPRLRDIGRAQPPPRQLAVRAGVGSVPADRAPAVVIGTVPIQDPVGAA